MTQSELRKAADYLEHLCLEINAANELRDHAQQLERNEQAEQIERRALERMDAPVTVNAGQLAQALHWIADHAWLSDKPVPNGALELMKTIANVHTERLEGVA